MPDLLYDLHLQEHLLHDHADEPRHDIDALVASGDCFVTLATQLDAVGHQLGHDGNFQPEVENVVRTLLYLQRHYQAVKKLPNYRQ